MELISFGACGTERSQSQKGVRLSIGGTSTEGHKGQGSGGREEAALSSRTFFDTLLRPERFSLFTERMATEKGCERADSSNVSRRSRERVPPMGTAGSVERQRIPTSLNRSEAPTARAEPDAGSHSHMRAFDVSIQTARRSFFHDMCVSLALHQLLQGRVEAQKAKALNEGAMSIISCVCGRQQVQLMRSAEEDSNHSVTRSS